MVVRTELAVRIFQLQNAPPGIPSLGAPWGGVPSGKRGGTGGVPCPMRKCPSSGCPRGDWLDMHLVSTNAILLDSYTVRISLDSSHTVHHMGCHQRGVLPWALSTVRPTKMAIPITAAMATDKITIRITRAVGRADGVSNGGCEGISGMGMVGGAKELGRIGAGGSGGGESCEYKMHASAHTPYVWLVISLSQLQQLCPSRQPLSFVHSTCDGGGGSKGGGGDKGGDEA
jgi:hypothetical protein